MPNSASEPTKPSRRDQGLEIEDRAAVHLEGLGLRILARNVYARVGELDIVAFDPGPRLLVFVEVRGRTSWESGIESIGPVKQYRLKRMIEFYLWKNPERLARLRARGIRVDALGWDGLGWDHRPGIEL